MKQNNKEELLNDEDGVSVQTLFSKIFAHIRYLRSKWKIILVFVIIGLVLGVYVSIVKKKKYTAYISFVVEDQGGQSQSGIAGLASELGVSVGSSKTGIFAGYNIISFFQSRLMIQKTFLTPVTFEDGKTDLLINRYIQYNHFREGWAKDPKLKNLTFKLGDSLTRQQDSVLYYFCEDMVYKHLNVERADKRLTILTLSVFSPDELFSKNFAETLAQNVIDFYTTTRTRKTIHNIDILQRQTDSVRTRLGRSLINVASSFDNVPNANPLKKVLTVNAQYKSVDADIDRSALLQLASNLQTAKISLNQERPLISFIDTPILPLPSTKLGKIKGGFLGAVLGFVFIASILTLRRKTY